MLAEFAVAYWDRGDLTKVEVHVEPTVVRIVAAGSAEMSTSEWDHRRAQVATLPHSQWPAIYKGTSIAPAIAYLGQEAMMAFCELHMFAPDTATAMAYAKDPALVAAGYPRSIVVDGQGNALRLLHPLADDNEKKAADGLMRRGILHRLDVIACPSPGRCGQFHTYFMPFHIPGVGTSELTSEEHALKSSVPIE